ncbi:hypothetical protein San01_58010 [Streptomyces angustmyceticus]|uniref:Uncharacterized protein n=1 Tax=Streptomyces angustmyceticus TaxID=285578 RepID=A0A5J4LGS7_9ACTN|nr:hypothetical protein San01_58010 [Streptomyces angustmyceticus]
MEVTVRGSLRVEQNDRTQYVGCPARAIRRPGRPRGTPGRRPALTAAAYALPVRLANTTTLSG